MLHINITWIIEDWLNIHVSVQAGFSSKCNLLLSSVFNICLKTVFWVCASYQLIMNSLHHGVLPATEGREKQMFHAPFAVDNISLGLSALQTTLWNTCPADIQLIVSRLTDEQQEISRPWPSHSKPTPPPAAAGDTKSKGGGSSQLCWAHLGHGLICSIISDTNTGLSDTNIGLPEGSWWAQLRSQIGNQQR